MTVSADGLNIKVMFRGISFVMIVFVSSLALTPKHDRNQRKEGRSGEAGALLELRR